MLTLVFIASLAQPQPGQKLLRADLVRSPKGSNLVLEFAKPIKRTRSPSSPGRRLVLHLPVAAARGHVKGCMRSRRLQRHRATMAQPARKTLRRPSDRSG